jgi:Fe2+ transport system protein FeoA
MAHQVLTCPLCGFEFERADALCHHGCPLGAFCNLARCPACDYEFPEKLPSATGPWWRRLFGKTAPEAACPATALTVVDLKGGESAEVLGLGGDSPARRNNLAVFGLVPGCEVRLLQRYPSFVVRVGETILALEDDVARDIVVRRMEAGAALAG